MSSETIYIPYFYIIRHIPTGKNMQVFVMLKVVTLSNLCSRMVIKHLHP